MTITNGVAGFLTARVDEDEAMAKRDLAHGVWRPEYERALREAEVKRAILALHNRTHDCPVSSTVQSADKGPWLYIASEHVEVAHAEWPCTTLRHLAAVYSDHPDYRQEWEASAPQRAVSG